MSTFSFRNKKPLSLRLWHWLNAAAILGLLTTVLLRKTVLSWRTNSALIETRLQEIGVSITPEFAKQIAVEIRNPLWDWHIILGFALSALLFSRVVVALVVEKRLPITHARRSLQYAKSAPPEERGDALHYALVKVWYVVFYFVTALMVATGLSLVFKAELGFSKDLLTSIKETHELLMWFFVVFVAGHLLGVVFVETRKDPGLVSDMIHGGPEKSQSN